MEGNLTRAVTALDAAAVASRPMRAQTVGATEHEALRRLAFGDPLRRRVTLWLCSADAAPVRETPDGQVQIHGECAIATQQIQQTCVCCRFCLPGCGVIA